jgi:hypothetical protein
MKMMMMMACLALASCAKPNAPVDDCGGKSALDYVDQKTGRLDRDPETNEIVDPRTGHVAISAAEEACIVRRDRAILNAS